MCSWSRSAQKRSKLLLRDRSEEEVRGYREALTLIHDTGSKLLLTENACKKLHHLTRGEIWDAAKYKEKDSDIIEKRPDGTSSIRFQTSFRQTIFLYLSLTLTPALIRAIFLINWKNSGKYQETKKRQPDSHPESPNKM